MGHGRPAFWYLAVFGLLVAATPLGTPSAPEGSPSVPSQPLSAAAGEAMPSFPQLPSLLRASLLHPGVQAQGGVPFVNLCLYSLQGISGRHDSVDTGTSTQGMAQVSPGSLSYALSLALEQPKGGLELRTVQRVALSQRPQAHCVPSEGGSDKPVHSSWMLVSVQDARGLGGPSLPALRGDKSTKTCPSSVKVGMDSVPPALRCWGANTPQGGAAVMGGALLATPATLQLLRAVDGEGHRSLSMKAKHSRLLHTAPHHVHEKGTETTPNQGASHPVWTTFALVLCGAGAIGVLGAVCISGGPCCGARGGGADSPETQAAGATPAAPPSPSGEGKVSDGNLASKHPHLHPGGAASPPLGAPSPVTGSGSHFGSVPMQLSAQRPSVRGASEPGSDAISIGGRSSMGGSIARAMAAAAVGPGSAVGALSVGGRHSRAASAPDARLRHTWGGAHGPVHSLGEEGDPESTLSLQPSVIASRSGSIDMTRLPGNIITLANARQDGMVTPTRRPARVANTTPSDVVPVVHTHSTGAGLIDDSVSTAAPHTPQHSALQGGCVPPLASSSDYGDSVHSVREDSQDSVGLLAALEPRSPLARPTLPKLDLGFAEPLAPPRGRSNSMQLAPLHGEGGPLTVLTTDLGEGGTVQEMEVAGAPARSRLMSEGDRDDYEGPVVVRAELVTRSYGVQGINLASIPKHTRHARSGGNTSFLYSLPAGGATPSPSLPSPSVARSVASTSPTHTSRKTASSRKRSLSTHSRGLIPLSGMLGGGGAPVEAVRSTSAVTTSLIQLGTPVGGSPGAVSASVGGTSDPAPTLQKLPSAGLSSTGSGYASPKHVGHTPVAAAGGGGGGFGLPPRGPSLSPTAAANPANRVRRKSRSAGNVMAMQ